jgi:PKD repeat protein
MQEPVFYSNQPPVQPIMPAQQTSKPIPGHVLNRLTYYILPVMLVVFVGASMFWLQWASQRGIALGYPTPRAHIVSSAAGTVQPGSAVQFTADSQGRGLTYQWEFGDNTSLSGASVSHTYQSGGTYTVTLTVRDVINQSSTTTQTVNVALLAPQATFTYTNNGYGYIYFDASGSTADRSTSIATYNWQFGDGATDSTGNSQDSHSYNNYGSYTVTLTVTDASGQTSSAYTQSIAV